jgi:hypothetical protein
MDLGDGLQTAEVVVGAANLLVAALGTYLTWRIANGKPLPPPQGPLYSWRLANDAALAQFRHWEQQVLPMYQPRAMRPINNRRATISKVTGSLADFAKRITSGLVS